MNNFLSYEPFNNTKQVSSSFILLAIGAGMTPSVHVIRVYTRRLARGPVQHKTEELMIPTQVLYTWSVRGAA